ncbi:SpoIIE family protein phosphatase [Caenimonas sedimenti]|uniref:SpoIIE family protein phosphatase n=1 Tax=Caenimonas sedimenti TaxID=2596921 RepID=A0A562ZN75_9BURK|nr:SpoIIE family protein phosphatase [Caenimonas sedimenti]TWO69973.1 SpoIIE family protein phosphatase [Caenimonas sedimenti]
METTIEVTEQSQVAEARRAVADLGAEVGLSAHDLGRAALVATEACTNLVKYGRQGVMVLSKFSEAGARGVQLIAIDSGPGFANFGASARDGHSTGGSLGVGLGAIMRSSDLFDCYTREGQGSALLSRVSAGAVPVQAVPGSLWVGSRASAKLGHVESGDAWGVFDSRRLRRLCVADGLGHGPLAAIAGHAAITAFHAAALRDTPQDILQQAHVALKSTRGAVMAVLALDTEAGTATFSGVGNIVAMLHSESRQQHMVSTEGIVGYSVRVFRSHEYAWTPGSTAILASDGLSSRWNLIRYPGLMARHPALIAAVLYRDYARDTDDATVVVAKVAP